MSDTKPMIATGKRRNSIRFPAQVETVALWSRTTAGVIDESFSGIALVVDAKVEVCVGQEVSVEYDGAAMPAVVCRVDEHVDGGHVVGLAWKAPPKK